MAVLDPPFSIFNIRRNEYGWIEVIRTRKPRTVRVDLLDDISSDSPAVCGGIMNVFIDPWWNERDQEATSANK